MRDAGVVLEVRRVDASPLTPGDHARVEAMVDELRGQELISELGMKAEWKADGSVPGVARVIVFELWSDDIDLNVLEPDGSIRPPTYVTQLIDGEEVDIPEAPPEGNPGPDEMLALLLERNRARLSSALAKVDVPSELSAAALSEQW